MEEKTEIQNENKTEEKPTLVDDAIKTAERIEKANSETKALLDRKERLMAQEKLGGRTSIQQIPIVAPIKSYKDQCTEAVREFEEKKFNPFKHGIS